MKIDAGMPYHHATQPPRVTAGAGSVTTSFAATLAASQANSAGQAEGARQTGGTRQPDFTSMTRQDMRDWVNTRIRNGEMSLDESRPLMAMTMKVPVDGARGVAVGAENDATRYDFTRMAREGIQGALLRKDETTLEMLKSAMSMMQDQQGRPSSVGRYA